MHIYLAYLILDKTLKNKYPYLINYDAIQYNSNGMSVSLYGFTDNKNIILDFCKTRNSDIFYYKKKKIKKKDYLDFKMKYILYEIEGTKLFGYNKDITITEIEKMISNDINNYAPSIEKVINSHKINNDKKSIDFIKHSDLEKIMDKLYYEYKTCFDTWLLYFAPTIDIKNLYLNMKG